MILQPHGGDRYPLVPKPPDQLDGAPPLGRALELVVVVVQLRVGVGLVGEPERRGEVVLSQNREPGGAAQRAVVAERFVHDVPAFDPAPVASHHGVDVVAQPREQGVPAHRRAGRVLEHPARCLVVPDQVMPDDEHAVPLAECDVAVGGREVVRPGPGMHRRPFERVLGRDRVELRLHDRGAEGVLAGKLRRVERRADEKDTPERGAQRGRRGNGRRRRTCAAERERAHEDGERPATPTAARRHPRGRCVRPRSCRPP